MRSALGSLLLFGEHVARLISAGWVNRRPTLFDVADNTIFIYDESGARAKSTVLIKDAIILHCFAFEIAQQRKGDSEILREAFVGGRTVNADSENLCAGGFEFGDISLIRLQFLRSTTGESEYVEGQHDILLAFEIAQLHRLSVGVRQSKVGRRVTNL